MLSTRDPPQNKGHIQTESEVLEKKIFHTNRDEKKAGVTILISDKIDFKIKAMKIDIEGHYILIKGSIQEDITIINICAPSIGAPQYVRQILMSMKGEINNNIIIVGDFNTLLTPIDRTTIQKINRETQTLNDTMYKLDLIDIYRTFHPKTINFNFSSSEHGIFSRIDHIMGHKISLGKFKKKKNEKNPVIFCNHNAKSRSQLQENFCLIPTYGGLITRF